MKRQRPLRLSIPQPCDQRWEDMQPQSGGRHCDRCDRTLVDFTAMSDAEILHHLRTHGKACGRFHQSQLDRPLWPASPPSKWSVAALGTWVTLLSAACTPASKEEVASSPAHAVVPAETAPVEVVPVETAPIDSARMARADSLPPEGALGREDTVVMARGKVVDAATKKPIPGVTVLLVGTFEETVTDSRGRFQLDVSSGIWDSFYRLEFIHPEYTIQVSIFAVNEAPNMRIALQSYDDPEHLAWSREQAHVTLGIPAYVEAPTPPPLFQRVRKRLKK